MHNPALEGHVPTEFQATELLCFSLRKDYFVSFPRSFSEITIYLVSIYTSATLEITEYRGGWYTSPINILEKKEQGRRDRVFNSNCM